MIIKMIMKNMMARALASFVLSLNYVIFTIKKDLFVSFFIKNINLIFEIETKKHRTMFFKFI